MKVKSKTFLYHFAILPESNKLKELPKALLKKGIGWWEYL
jgi:hypothetical protein